MAGSYLFGPGAERRFWQVQAVVVDGKVVNVYALEVSPMLAGELQAAWATWGEPAEAGGEAHPAERAARGRGA